MVVLLPDYDVGVYNSLSQTITQKYHEQAGNVERMERRGLDRG